MFVVRDRGATLAWWSGVDVGNGFVLGLLDQITRVRHKATMFLKIRTAIALNVQIFADKAMTLS